MNCFAARLTRPVRSKRVCMSSITITYTRPSNGTSLVLTSGSTGSAAPSGRWRCSTGMLTSEKAVIVCGRPSSSTWKSSFFRSETMAPARSVTRASTST